MVAPVLTLTLQQQQRPIRRQAVQPVQVQEQQVALTPAWAPERLLAPVLQMVQVPAQALVQHRAAQQVPAPVQALAQAPTVQVLLRAQVPEQQVQVLEREQALVQIQPAITAAPAINSC